MSRGWSADWAWMDEPITVTVDGNPWAPKEMVDLKPASPEMQNLVAASKDFLKNITEPVKLVFSAPLGSVDWSLLGHLAPGESVTFTPTKAENTMYQIYTQGSPTRTVHDVRKAMEDGLYLSSLLQKNDTKRTEVLNEVMVPVKQIAQELYEERMKTATFRQKEFQARQALKRALPTYSPGRDVDAMIDELDALRRARTTPAEASLKLIKDAVRLEEGADIVTAVKNLRTKARQIGSQEYYQRLRALTECPENRDLESWLTETMQEIKELLARIRKLENHPDTLWVSTEDFKKVIAERDAAQEAMRRAQAREESAKERLYKVRRETATRLDSIAREANLAKKEIW